MSMQHREPREPVFQSDDLTQATALGDLYPDATLLHLNGIAGDIVSRRK